MGEKKEVRRDSTDSICIGGKSCDGQPSVMPVERMESLINLRAAYRGTQMGANFTYMEADCSSHPLLQKEQLNQDLLKT